jgi:hypothetical protein
VPVDTTTCPDAEDDSIQAFVREGPWWRTAVQG